MRKTCLVIVLLGVVAFCLATHLDEWFQGWAGNRASSANVLAIALGDGRRMFANHFFLKADSYFHSGYYPTIYDNRDKFQTSHVAEDAGAIEGANEGDDHSFLGPPTDWIDRFGRNFFPSVHTHLDEQKRAQAEVDEAAEEQDSDAHAGHLHAKARGHDDDPDHSQDHPEHGSSSNSVHSRESEQEKHLSAERVSGLEREILPWLRLSSELDPERVESFAVGAYWLRRMGRSDEAERFLRDGLRANPGNPQLLFELGQLQLETRKDPSRTRNLWELALRNWNQIEAKKDEPNTFLLIQLLGNLAKLEEQAADTTKALSYLERLKTISPQPDAIQKWMDGLKAP